MASDREADDTGVGGSVLARSLGLTDAEVGAVGEVVAGQLTAMGLDGHAVFGRIRDGEAIGAALGFPPETGDILYARAYQWIQIGRHDRAEPLFRALCVLDGRKADYWIGYGLCLRERRADADAALAFSTAARLKPQWAVPHFHAFAQAATMGDWAKVDEHWRRFQETEGAGTPEPVRQEARRLKTAIDAFRSVRRGA